MVEEAREEVGSVWEPCPAGRMEGCLVTAASALVEDSPSVREFGLCHVAFLGHLDSVLG